MNFKDDGKELTLPFLCKDDKIMKVFESYKASLGLHVNGKCYMSEEKRIKARKKRKKRK